MSDWGLVRNPEGETTTPGRTRVGTSYGTEGFAAPELSVDAHAATPAADVYGIGQIIGWVLTGQWPHQNVPQLPDGPWRPIVRAATKFTASERLQGVAELTEEIERAFAVVPLLPVREAAGILDALPTDSTGAEEIDRLFDLAASNPDDYSLFIDQLPRMSPTQVRVGVRRDPRELVMLRARC